MTRPKGYIPKRIGRPVAHTITEKHCPQCGRLFGMADVGVKFPSHFAPFRYCSVGCRTAATQRGSGNLREYLESNSILREDTGCIEWTRSRYPKGYGKASKNGKTVRAHRLSYETYIGPIPEGLMILHSCDNPPCINPSHLRVGTARDNWMDCISRGRTAKPMRIISAEQREIIKRSDDTITKIAQRYGVSKTTVWRIAGSRLTRSSTRGAGGDNSPALVANPISGHPKP